MGNQLASRKNLTVYQQDAQKYWAKIQTTNYCQIVKHGQTQKIGQMYYKQTQNLLQQANNYQFRKDNAQYLVSALSIFKTNHIICSEVSHFNVIIQRIPFRFADLGQITYDQGLYIINQSLRGFEQLRKKIGVAHIEDTLICINNHGKCKVWINENISQNFPNQKIDVAQNQQVNELLQIVQQKISKSQLQRRNYGKIKQHYQIKDFKSAILFVEYLIRQSGLRINQVRIPDYYLPQSIQSSVLESIRKSTKKKSLSKNHSAKYAFFKFDNCNKNVRNMLQRRSKQKAFISPDKNLRLYTQVNDNSVYSTKQQDELTQSYTSKNLNKTLNFGKNDISPVNIKTNHNINQVAKIQRTPKKKQAYMFDLKFKTQQKNKILYQQPIIQRQSIYWSDIKCNYEGKNGRDFSRTKPSFNFNVNTSHFNKNDDQWMVRGKINHENDQSLNKTKDATPQNSILDSKFHNNRVDLKYNRSEAIRQILNRPLVADKYFRR